MLVFISWSGARSKAVAEALEIWLAQVIQAIEPWISQDISKGLRWGREIASRLESSKVGIICLTESNLDAKWIHFEAGALSKTEDAYVCTLLLGIKPSDVEQPLAQFQHTTTEKQDIYQLLSTINMVVEKSGGKALTETILRKVFETYWPLLQATFRETETIQEETPSPPRSTDELLEEVLEILRNQMRRQNRPSQIAPLLSRHEWQAAELAVFDWLSRQYPERVSEGGPREGVDFILNRPEGPLIGVEVQFYRTSVSMAAIRIKDEVLKLQRKIAEGRWAQGLIVLVAANSSILGRLNDAIDELEAPNISFAIGLLNSSGEFEAVRSTPFDF